MKSKTAEEIAKEILYFPVTNGQAEISIKKGAELIELYAGQSRWISVDDELPENRSYVLVYTTNGGYTSSAEYKHGCFFNGLDRLNDVTHYQPLPTPPTP